MDKQVIKLAYPLHFLLVSHYFPKRITCVTELYQSIWLEGSPIREVLFQQADTLGKLLQDSEKGNFVVEGAMTYGFPSI